MAKINIKTAIFTIMIFMFAWADISFSSEIQRSTLKIDNLSCSSCVNNIESRLKSNKAVKGMSADLREKVINIDHDISLSASQLTTMIAKAGYGATVIAEQKIKTDQVMSFSNNNYGPCGSGGCDLPSNNCNATRAAWKELYRRFINR